MKQRFDSDLGTAIEKSCRGLLVDAGSCNDKSVCVGGGADIAGFGVLYVCIATLAQAIIANAKRNGFDNFTGNFLSHLITPTITIVAKSRGQIK